MKAATLGHLSPRTGDLLLAAGMAVAGAGGVVAELNEAVPVPSAPGYGGLLIAVASGGVLCWRRRAPIAVASGIVGLCLLYHLLGYPGLAPAISMFAAIYSVTASSTRRWLLLISALIVAVAVIPVLPPNPAGFNPGALFGPPIAMIGVATMGEAARVRRAAVEQRLLALRRATEQRTRRELAEQRLEIARELHDVLAHTITVISVQAAVGTEALDERPMKAREALATVRAAAREALTELRGTLVALRVGDQRDPQTSSQPGLADLPRLVEQTAAGGVDVRTTIDGEPRRLPAAVELAVYRIVQESLTNTIRHSQADSATVVLTYSAELVAVAVTDRGPAEPTAPSAAHAAHGLTGMRERVRALGGTLDAGPHRGGGFRVVAQLPIGRPI